MNLSDYSVEGLDAIWDIVELYDAPASPVIVNTLENDLYEHSNY